MSQQSTTLRLFASAIAIAVLTSVDVSPAIAAGASTHAQLATSVSSDSVQDPLSPDLWIDDTELARLMRAGAVIVVDVRDTTSYRRAHLLGAMSVPLSEVIARADELRAAGKPIVAYCGGPVGENGARAALMLRKHGLPARALSGGFGGWVARAYVVEVPIS